MVFVMIAIVDFVKDCDDYVEEAEHSHYDRGMWLLRGIYRSKS